MLNRILQFHLEHRWLVLRMLRLLRGRLRKLRRGLLGHPTILNWVVFVLCGLMGVAINGSRFLNTRRCFGKGARLKLGHLRQVKDKLLAQSELEAGRLIQAALQPERTPTVGVDALLASLENFNKLKDGRMRITTHFMGNLNFNALESDVAETETNAIAFLVLKTGEPKNEITTMRSLRYLDRWRKVGEDWLICERQHTLDWSSNVPTAFATETAKRINSRPSRTDW